MGFCTSRGLTEGPRRCRSPGQIAGTEADEQRAKVSLPTGTLGPSVGQMVARFEPGIKRQHSLRRGPRRLQYKQFQAPSGPPSPVGAAGSKFREVRRRTVPVPSDGQDSASRPGREQVRIGTWQDGEGESSVVLGTTQPQPPLSVVVPFPASPGFPSPAPTAGELDQRGKATRPRRGLFITPSPTIFACTFGGDDDDDNEDAGTANRDDRGDGDGQESSSGEWETMDLDEDGDKSQADSNEAERRSQSQRLFLRHQSFRSSRALSPKSPFTKVPPPSQSPRTQARTKAGSTPSRRQSSRASFALCGRSKLSKNQHHRHYQVVKSNCQTRLIYSGDPELYNRDTSDWLPRSKSQSRTGSRRHSPPGSEYRNHAGAASNKNRSQPSSTHSAVDLSETLVASQGTKQEDARSPGPNRSSRSPEPEAAVLVPAIKEPDLESLEEVVRADHDPEKESSKATHPENWKDRQVQTPPSPRSVSSASTKPARSCSTEAVPLNLPGSGNGRDLHKRMQTEVVDLRDMVFDSSGFDLDQGPNILPKMDWNGMNGHRMDTGPYANDVHPNQTPRMNGKHMSSQNPQAAYYHHTETSSPEPGTDALSNYSFAYSGTAYDDCNTSPPPMKGHRMSTLSIQQCDDDMEVYAPDRVHPDLGFRLEWLETELRRVSSELAHSIRREMELEDELARSQEALELAQVQPADYQRSSDYYSDMEVTNARMPISDIDAKIERLEKARRQAEQDKARIQVELTDLLQQETEGRRVAEERAAEATARVEQLRRQLSGERSVKDSFEELMTGMRAELEQARDDVSTANNQVHRRGMEMDAIRLELAQVRETAARAAVEHAAALEKSKAELSELKSGQLAKTFESAVTTEAGGSSAGPGLNRSMSLATRRTPARRTPGAGTLSRAGSVRSSAIPENMSLISPVVTTWNSGNGPHSAIPGGTNDRLQNVEEQREALRSTVRTLRAQLTHQAAMHSKELRRLAQQMNEAVASAGLVATLNPGGSISVTVGGRGAGGSQPTFAAAVARLRHDMQALRQRADDLVDQKWRCEKGLGGLKMDFDRARADADELEMILVSGEVSMIESVATVLQSAYYFALAYLEQHKGEPVSAKELLHALRVCLSGSAEERAEFQGRAGDFAHLSRRATSILAGGSGAGPVHTVATRLAALVPEAESQQAQSVDFFSRVEKAASAGKGAYNSSVARLTETEARLQKLEEAVVAAQARAESALAGCEEDVAALSESHDLRLLRIERTGPLSVGPDSVASIVRERRAELDEKREHRLATARRNGKQLAAVTGVPARRLSVAEASKPKVSVAAGVVGATVPISTVLRAAPSRRREWADVPFAQSVDEAAGVSELEGRLDELELVIHEADGQLSELMGQMSVSQVRVEGLQAERDELVERASGLVEIVESEKEQWCALLDEVEV